MKKISEIAFLFLALLCSGVEICAQTVTSYKKTGGSLTFETIDGRLTLTPLTDNAVRVSLTKQTQRRTPELVYVDNVRGPKFNVKESDGMVRLVLPRLTAGVERATGRVHFFSADGRELLCENSRTLTPSTVQGEATYVAEARFSCAADECLAGLGQFQDGYLNVRGLMRRLTQVNTQISVPMVLSSRGYALLWNNYGRTDFNPSDRFVSLQKATGNGLSDTVNVTSTAGNRREVRSKNVFEGTIAVEKEGLYSFLLDVGQTMARRLNLEIDGRKLIDIQNMWLPPTGSVIAHLSKGEHHITAELSEQDNPKVYYQAVTDATVLRSPVSEAVDYTVFAGNADEALGAYRTVTGQAPLMPKWALGYIHCRERFHSQRELLDVARHFRREGIPVDIFVQDWQYWGRYGWNAMRFDETNYPDAKAMTDTLHQMHQHLMVSVWANPGQQTEVGQLMAAKGYYIPNTPWVDFFNPAAADMYWQQFRSRMLPYGIDAWWQDATEPENDDLHGRMVMSGTVPGDVYRNVYPLMINHKVYTGWKEANPDRRTMILTRSGFSGIQRYGVANWSGDVSDSWESFRRQLTAGLGLMAAGLPWWTYDAGGFFRNSRNQYTDTLYHERMLRWIQTATFLPLMRVHGYQSDTEPWNYGSKVERIAGEAIRLRYRLMPYIYSGAADVAFGGGTLMRPLIMDFPGDAKALAQPCEFMFGRSLLIAPITEGGVRTWSVYLPDVKGGWYDFWDAKRLSGSVTVATTLEHIPVFVKAGTVLTMADAALSTAEQSDSVVNLRIYPGADGEATLYADDGVSFGYERGACSRITFRWNDVKQELTIEDRQGSYATMPKVVHLNIAYADGRNPVSVVYKGKKMKVSRQAH